MHKKNLSQYRNILLFHLPLEKITLFAITVCSVGIFHLFLTYVRTIPNLPEEKITTLFAVI